MDILSDTDEFKTKESVTLLEKSDENKKLGLFSPYQRGDSKNRYLIVSLTYSNFLI